MQHEDDPVKMTAYVTAAERRKLKTILAARGESYSDWMRRKMQEEFEQARKEQKQC